MTYTRLIYFYDNHSNSHYTQKFSRNQKNENRSNSLRQHKKQKQIKQVYFKINPRENTMGSFSIDNNMNQINMPSTSGIFATNHMNPNDIHNTRVPIPDSSTPVILDESIKTVNHQHNLDLNFNEINSEDKSIFSGNMKLVKELASKAQTNNLILAAMKNDSHVNINNIKP